MYAYGVSSIYVVGATSGSPLLLLEGAEVMQPAWSPDGTKIALVAQSFVTREDYTYDIYTINSDGTGFTTLTRSINAGYDIFNCPSWSPNGAKLAVVFTGEQQLLHPAC